MSAYLPSRVRTLAPTQGYQVLLEPLYVSVSARAADVTGDGHDELIVGYRREGTGQILDVDVVGTDRTGAPAVLAHDSVYKGSVRTRRHRLVEYEPVYGREDGNCCPTWIVRRDVRFRDGAFRVHTTWRRPTQRVDVPPSDIG